MASFTWPALALALALLTVLIVPAFSLQLRTPRAEALASGAAAQVGLAALRGSGIATGALTPIEVIAPRATANDVARRLRTVPGVRAVLAPDTAAWRGERSALVAVIPSYDINTALVVTSSARCDGRLGQSLASGSAARPPRRATSSTPSTAPSPRCWC